MGKKLFLSVLMMMMFSMTVLAEGDLQVQIIGGPEDEFQPTSLDDMQIGKSYTIDGYAIVKPTEAMFVDYFAQFNKDADYNAYGDDREERWAVYYTEEMRWFKKQASWMESGLNADFYWLRLEITNAQKKPVNFEKNASVKMVYDEDYEFNGWIRQANLDYNTQVFRYGIDTKGGTIAVLDPENAEAIDMMYTGTYIMGCTLPNSVVEDEKTPLSIVITMDGNEMTYNVRK